jgi:hypothetical protein
MIETRVRYLARSLRRSVIPSACLCPSCAGRRERVVDRKFWITALARCNRYRLLYRVPSDPVSYHARFSEQEYSSGMTTEMPDADELQGLCDSHFTANGEDRLEGVQAQ